MALQSAPQVTEAAPARLDKDAYAVENMSDAGVALLAAEHVMDERGIEPVALPGDSRLETHARLLVTRDGRTEFVTAVWGYMFEGTFMQRRAVVTAARGSRFTSFQIGAMGIKLLPNADGVKRMFASPDTLFDRYRRSIPKRVEAE